MRRDRVAPARDDKVLASWNGLTFGALAVAGAVFGRPEWIAAAERTARFVTSRMVDDERRLWHRWTPDHGAGIAGFAEDTTYVAAAMLDLYEAMGRWVTSETGSKARAALAAYVQQLQPPTREDG